MADFVLGLDAKLYRNTGSFGSPNWTLMPNVKDLTLGLEKDEADVTTRGANGWKQMAATLKNANVEFQMVWNPTDAGFTAIKNAFLNNTNIEMLVLDGAYNVTGSQGLRAEMMVANFTREENLTEALTVNVSVKPAYSVNAPSWFTAP